MLFDKCCNYTKCCNNIHSNLMKILKKFVNKIVKEVNHYKPLTILLLLISQIYHPFCFLRHSILNIHHKAMNLCIQKGYL